MTNPDTTAADRRKAAEDAVQAATAEVERLRAELAETLDQRNAHGPDSEALSRELGRTAADGRRAALARHPRKAAEDADAAQAAATGGRRHTATDDQAEDEISSTSWADGAAEARRRIEARTGRAA